MLSGWFTITSLERFKQSRNDLQWPRLTVLSTLTMIHDDFSATFRALSTWPTRISETFRVLLGWSSMTSQERCIYSRDDSQLPLWNVSGTLEMIHNARFGQSWNESHYLFRTFWKKKLEWYTTTLLEEEIMIIFNTFFGSERALTVYFFFWRRPKFFTYFYLIF